MNSGFSKNAPRFLTYFSSKASISKPVISFTRVGLVNNFSDAAHQSMILVIPSSAFLVSFAFGYKTKQSARSTFLITIGGDFRALI